jgi:hypothetical protein
MGYQTDFKGEFKLSRNLTQDEFNTINSIQDQRHEYSTHPSIWCNWEVLDYGTEQCLQWNEAEKFYNYIEWLKYLIDNYFNPWGVTLEGKILWRGEDFSDVGVITIDGNNIVKTKGLIEYEV